MIKSFSHRPLSMGVKLAALAVATTVSSTAYTEQLLLEEIVVTASPWAQSKMDSSVSVSTVSSERIDNFVARSTTEIFRSIPGVRSESSAGESNTNISIRGIPVASGGGKFIQLHEDGLPVLQFGDVIVGNADNYISYDWTVKRVEAVKGGTAATLSSNAPAGVINFVSKTGEEKGGSFGITTGLDFDSQRLDFEYGQPLNDEWSYHIGGFYREGEGVRELDYDGNKGGQVKLSVKRNFERGNVRVYAKVLDDRTATYLPMPMQADGSSVRGFDSLSGANIPSELLSNRTGDFGVGVRNSSIADGSKVESKVVGWEMSFDLDESITLRDKLRLAKNSGQFFGAFTAALGSATDPAGISSVLGAADGLAYASGSNAGTLLTSGELANLNGNGLIQNIRSFDNDINSLDNFSHDISLTKTFETFEVTAGYYTASQDVDVDWYWQTYIADVSDNSRLLDAYQGATPLTSGGLVAFGAPDWGFCCYRNTELETDLDAYYVAVRAGLTDALTVTASYRHDEGDGIGHYAFGSNTAVDFDNDGILSLAEQNAQVISQATVDASQYKYDWAYDSFAVGANLALTDYTAIFANASKGGRANADRLGDGGFIINGGVAPGSVENTVKQYEFGVKHENNNFGIFATAFYVETDDVNSEGTAGLNNSARVREYESLGLELEAVANIGSLSLFGGLTYADAEIVGSNDSTLVGNKPRRQADFVYSGSAVYTFAGAHSVGVSMIGTTDSYTQDANNLEMDGYTYFNLFGNYQLTGALRVTVSVNNVTDQEGVTEAEEDSPATINGVDYIRGRSIAGRSTTLALKYDF